MAKPLFWRGKYFFYPIGNTPAVCLSKDIAPEEPANILLLGCGDPRNILFTIYCEPDQQTAPTRNPRPMDFTSCDFDPAVLSRNVILFTMLLENVAIPIIWNTFFHIYLDKQSSLALLAHTKKLLQHSNTLEDWSRSPYAICVKFSTAYTLSEIRRHWQLYIDMENLPPNRMHDIQQKFKEQSKSVVEKKGSVLSSARSAGPVLKHHSMMAASEHYRHYWRTGTVAINSLKGKASKNTLLNSTFVYSVAGEGCNVHYGTDPLATFQLAAAHGSAKPGVTMWDLGQAAFIQFSEWCGAFKTVAASAKSPVMRFIVGEAIAVCSALDTFATTGKLKPGIPVSWWKTQHLELNAAEYTKGGAPISFNVIDTSNLADHIGLLNILLATAPLIPHSMERGVVYTETLLYESDDATKEFTKRLFMDLGAFSLIFGLCPVDYLSGFTTRSNMHELMLHQSTNEDGQVRQYQQVVSWKSSAAADRVAVSTEDSFSGINIDPVQLGTFLYDTYQRMFEQHDGQNFRRIHAGNILSMQRAITMSSIVHYGRETFVILLSHIKSRLGRGALSWPEVMDRFNDLQLADTSIPMDTLSRHELATHLQIRDVFITPQYRGVSRKIGPFKDWSTVPSIVRIFVVFPREKLAVLKKSQSTPPLLASVCGKRTMNTYCSAHAAFGKAVPMGSKSQRWISFVEDPLGFEGSSSLVVSFACMSIVLTEVEAWEDLRVSLNVMSLPATSIAFVPDLGGSLEVCSANLMDQSSVFIVPESVQVPRRGTHPQLFTPPNLYPTTIPSAIGPCGIPTVLLDDECELIKSVTLKISVTNENAITLFSVDKVTPIIKQVSPCVIQVSISDMNQNLLYPFPIVGSRNTLRLARKSLYIEVEVPIFGPAKPDGIKHWRFPVINAANGMQLFNVHRINISRMPLVDIKAYDAASWINGHIGSQMSVRERKSRKKQEDSDTLMTLKDSIHAIMIKATGAQGGTTNRVFSLADTATNNSDTIIFVEDIRYDLSSYTLVCNAFLLALNENLVPKLGSHIGKLLGPGDLVTVRMKEGESIEWKRLLPALAERCRFEWNHCVNCEYTTGGKIPISEELEEIPLCSCGLGKNTEGMRKEQLWKPFAPYVTKIALSPLFAVSYLENIGRDLEARRCFVCRGRGKPKIKTCSKCQKVRYCSDICQKKDWSKHKKVCKT